MKGRGESSDRPGTDLFRDVQLGEVEDAALSVQLGQQHALQSRGSCCAQQCQEEEKKNRRLLYLESFSEHCFTF